MIRRRVFCEVFAAVSIIASFMCLPVSAQDVNYLTKSHKPVAWLAFSKASEMPYQSGLERTFTDEIPLGGVGYKNGFALRTIYGPTQHGYVEYSLKGKYEKLMFILGASPFHSPDRTKGVFAVTGDGRKILDKVIEEHAAPERILLDVSGVDLLRFEIVTGDISIGVAEPTLWTAGQKPRETGRISLAPDRPVELVSDLRPYVVGSSHYCVSSAENDRHMTKINGKAYTSGLELVTSMQLIGTGWSWTLFNLGGKYKTLRFIVGPRDNSGGTLGVAWFTVKCDGKIIYEYEISEANIAREVTLDVTGCRQLSFESEQVSGSSTIALADIMAYPEGTEPYNVADGAKMLVIGDYSGLPDVCKLISNIPPYQVTGTFADGDCVFDGKSEHITFSMGGVRHNEGIVLQSNTNFFNDNTRASALFNLAGEFDYVSFTAGWVGKCGVLKNDTLRVYTDMDIALEVPLVATAPPQKYIVPLNRCLRLTFEKRGMNSLSHPAFGVADIVVYRGKPVENGLFVHPVPALPDEIDLIDLGKPYVHYVKQMSENMNQAFYDGSTQKRYFLVGQSRVNKGFVLQTCVHFDLEAGPLSEAGGETGVAAGALGSSIMVGSAGGATISAVSPFGALIALASGGTALESSCAAFNTYGAYDELTFTVASLSPAVSGSSDRAREKLLIGCDGDVVQEIELADDMSPTTFTIPIGKCSQLMFWLECGKATSGKYAFYDMSVRKGFSGKGIVAGGVSSVGVSAGAVAPCDPYVLPYVAFRRMKVEWEKPRTCNVTDIDRFYYDCQTAKSRFDTFLGAGRSEDSILIEELLGNLMEPESGMGAAGGYYTRGKYVIGSDGASYRAIELFNSKGKQLDFNWLIRRDRLVIDYARNCKALITNLKISQANANLSLLEAGLRAVAVGKEIKRAGTMIDAYKMQLDALIEEKEAEIQLIESLFKNSLMLDGVASDSRCVFIY